MYEYQYVVTPFGNGWSAYVPDLPGCIAAAETKEETEKLIREAIEFHIEGMQEDGIPLPPPTHHNEGRMLVA